MKRAYEAALAAYPVRKVRSTYGVGVIDTNQEKRNVYWLGYKQAEKDLSLTWKDIRHIVEIVAEFKEEIERGTMDPGLNSESKFFEDVLKEFNETRSTIYEDVSL